MQLRLLFIALTMLIGWNGQATKLKPYHFKGTCENLTQYFQYLETCTPLTEQEVVTHFYKGDFLQADADPKGVFNKGYTQCSYWLAINLTNETTREQKFLWSFYNNGLSFTFYELRKGKLVFIDQSSMHEPKAQRPYPVRSISFPFFLGQNKNKLLFVKISPTIHGNVYCLSDITNVEDYLWFEIDYSYLLGKYFGVFFLGFFINIAMFSVLKERIYIYNSLFIFLIFLFLLADYHFDSFQIPTWLFVCWSYINKGLYIALALFFYFKLFQIFTNQKEEYPRLYQVFNVYSIVILLTCLAELVFIFRLEYINTYRSIFGVISYVIDYVGFILISLAFVIGITQKKKYVILFALASSVMIYGFLSYLLNTLNLVDMPFLPPGNIINGLTVEISLFTVFLVYKYKNERELYNRQLIERIQLNERLTKKLMTIQEDERKNIAQNLHDEVGSSLTGLRLMVQSNLSHTTIPKAEQEAILDNIKSIYQRIRNISHQLRPKELENHTFIEVIKDQINLYKSNFPSIELELITNIEPLFSLTDELETNIYRIILEVISNSIQHAIATQVTVQIFKDHTSIRITIEDNGIGFDSHQKNEGIGLLNVKSRVDYLRGTISIDSNDSGTTLIIEIPIT